MASRWAFLWVGSRVALILAAAGPVYEDRSGIAAGDGSVGVQSAHVCGCESEDLVVRSVGRARTKAPSNTGDGVEVVVGHMDWCARRAGEHLSGRLHWSHWSGCGRAVPRWPIDA